MKKIINWLNTKIGQAVFWTVFPVVAFVILSALIKFLMMYFVQFFNEWQNIVANPIFVASYTVIFYLSLLAVLYFVPTKIFKMELTKESLGVSKEMTWSDMALGFVGFVVSMILAGILTAILAALFPTFNASQAQNLGFGGLVRPHEFAIAFACVVLLPSIIEELIFRGIIYGETRKINFWFAIILTSVLFGAAHQQLNVAVTTFAMSLVMCWTREKLTESIWAGVVLHFIKNSVAFVIIYILPNLMLG